MFIPMRTTRRDGINATAQKKGIREVVIQATYRVLSLAAAAILANTRHQ